MHQNTVTAIILAGGRSRRMGGVNKSFVQLDGHPLIQHVIDRITAQCGQIVISANHDLQQYAQFGLPVISDLDQQMNGPLAGLLSCASEIQSEEIICVTCDSPNIPIDLYSRLHQALEQSDKHWACVHDGQRIQPLFSLFHRACVPELTAYLASGQRRAIEWVLSQAAIQVDFSDQAEAFYNINTPEQLDKAQNNTINKHASS